MFRVPAGGAQRPTRKKHSPHPSVAHFLDYSLDPLTHDPTNQVVSTMCGVKPASTAAVRKSSVMSLLGRGCPSHTMTATSRCGAPGMVCASILASLRMSLLVAL